MSAAAGPPVESVAVDPTEQADLLLRDLDTDLHGLSQREADRRLVRFGRNELVRRGGRRWPRQLAPPAPLDVRPVRPPGLGG
jgi:Cation transporter/ATPase, N-terminus